ncbi:MAG: Phosphatidate cytidylyltransferase, partial [uncultured Solirubrobacteraceae bacterium]
GARAVAGPAPCGCRPPEPTPSRATKRIVVLVGSARAHPGRRPGHRVRDPDRLDGGRGLRRRRRRAGPRLPPRAVRDVPPGAADPPGRDAVARRPRRRRLPRRPAAGPARLHGLASAGLRRRVGYAAPGAIDSQPRAHAARHRLDRSADRLRDHAPRAPAWRRHHRRRPGRDLRRRHRGVSRRPGLRHPAPGAARLSEQDRRGPRHRDPHRGAGDLVRGPLPGLAQPRPGAAARAGGRRRRPARRSLRVQGQARRRDQGRRRPVRRPRWRARPPRRRAVHARRRLLRVAGDAL